MEGGGRDRNSVFFNTLVRVSSSLGLRNNDPESPHYYHKGVECRESLNDLLRYLRREEKNPERPALRHLGKLGVLEKDLIPLLLEYGDDPAEQKLVFSLLRLLVSLTLPAYLAFEQSNESEKVKQLGILEQNEYLLNYQAAFIQKEMVQTLDEDDNDNETPFALSVPVVLKKLLSMIEEPLSATVRTSTQDDTIELVLTLFRNILHVPQNQLDPSSNKQEETLMAFVSSGVVAFVMNMCNRIDEFGFFNMLLMEIVALIFRNLDAHSLVHDSRDMALKVLLEKEKVKNAASKKLMSTRHSHFGGSFQVQGLGHVARGYHGSVGNLLHNPSATTVTTGKRNKPRRAKPLLEPSQSAASSSFMNDMRGTLRTVSEAFLTHAYNPLVLSVFKRLAEGTDIIQSDKVHFLIVLRYFMEFHRHIAKFNKANNLFHDDTISEEIDVSSIASSLNLDVLSLTQRLIIEFAENIRLDKAGSQIHTIRLRHAIRAFHEILTQLMLFWDSKSPEQQEYANTAIVNVFYDYEFVHLLFKLVSDYHPQKQSLHYLSDLTLLIHSVLHIIKSYEKRFSSGLMSRKKGRGYRESDEEGDEEEDIGGEAEDRQDAQERRNEELEDGEGNLPGFIDDGEGEDEEGGGAALPPSSSYAGQDSVLNHDSETSHDLLSEPSIIDPLVQNLAGGHSYEPSLQMNDSMTLRDESSAPLETTLQSDSLSAGGSRSSPQPRVDMSTVGSGNVAAPNVAASSNENPPRQKKAKKAKKPKFKELEINFRGLQEMLADARVVSAYTHLLKHYKENSAEVNHCIAKMFYRIFDEAHCNQPLLFYQLSVLHVFRLVLDDPLTKHDKSFDEIRSFIKRGLLPKLFTDLQANPMLYVELLFLKSSEDIHELTIGAAAYQEIREKRKQKVWTADDKEKLKVLYEEHKDAYDVVLELTSALNKGEAAVRRHLVLLGVVLSDWTPRDTEKLKEAFQEAKHEADIVGAIMKTCTIQKEKNQRKVIRSKLLDIGVDPALLPVRAALFNWEDDDKQVLQEIFEYFKDLPLPIEKIIGMMKSDKRLNGRTPSAIYTQLKAMHLLTFTSMGAEDSEGYEGRDNDRFPQTQQTLAEFNSAEREPLPEVMKENLAAQVSLIRHQGIQAQMQLSSFIRTLTDRITSLEEGEGEESSLLLDKPEGVAYLGVVMKILGFEEEDSGEWVVPSGCRAPRLRSIIDCLAPTQNVSTEHHDEAMAQEEELPRGLSQRLREMGDEEPYRSRLSDDEEEEEIESEPDTPSEDGEYELGDDNHEEAVPSDDGENVASKSKHSRKSKSSRHERREAQRRKEDKPERRTSLKPSASSSPPPISSSNAANSFLEVLQHHQDGEDDRVLTAAEKEEKRRRSLALLKEQRRAKNMGVTTRPVVHSLARRRELSPTPIEEEEERTSQHLEEESSPARPLATSQPRGKRRLVRAQDSSDESDSEAPRPTRPSSSPPASPPRSAPSSPSSGLASRRELQRDKESDAEDEEEDDLLARLGMRHPNHPHESISATMLQESLPALNSEALFPSDEEADIQRLSRDAPLFQASYEPHLEDDLLPSGSSPLKRTRDDDDNGTGKKKKDTVEAESEDDLVF